MRRVLTPGGRAWIYELRREAALQDLRAFARETGLPFFLVYLGYKIVSRHHALPEREGIRRHPPGEPSGSHWHSYSRLTQLFWRGPNSGPWP